MCFHAVEIVDPTDIAVTNNSQTFLYPQAILLCLIFSWQAFSVAAETFFEILIHKQFPHNNFAIILEIIYCTFPLSHLRIAWFSYCLLLFHGPYVALPLSFGLSVRIKICCLIIN